MRILAFETSAKAASVALMEDGSLLAEAYQNAGLTHSRTILSMAEHLLQSCDRTMGDVNAIAVAMGPGSFTGVRIGMAAAKGLAWGRELPLYGVSTLEAMALGLGQLQGLVCPVMDARRSHSGFPAELLPGSGRTGPSPSRPWRKTCKAWQSL